MKKIWLAVVTIVVGSGVILPAVVFAETCAEEVARVSPSSKNWRCTIAPPTNCDPGIVMDDPADCPSVDEIAGICCAIPEPVVPTPLPSGVTPAGLVGPTTPPGTGSAKPSVTPAVVADPGSSIKLTNPLGANTTFFDIIRRVIKLFLGLVGALALLVFVYAGITWMTAGSSDRIQTAKDSMKYAVIGLALITFAYAITQFFFSKLGGG